jgi:hypothetical protein
MDYIVCCVFLSLFSSGVVMNCFYQASIYRCMKWLVLLVYNLNLFFYVQQLMHHLLSHQLLPPTLAMRTAAKCLKNFCCIHMEWVKVHQPFQNLACGCGPHTCSPTVCASLKYPIHIRIKANST